MVDLKLVLLGTPKITRTDNSVSIQRRKGIALLSYLAVTAQPHSRDSLATMFWPEYDQSGARGNLRRDLSRLKTELAMGPCGSKRTTWACTLSSTCGWTWPSSRPAQSGLSSTGIR